MKRSTNFMPRRIPRAPRDMMHCKIHRDRVATHRFAAWDGWKPMCAECAEWGIREGHGAAIEKIAEVEATK